MKSKSSLKSTIKAVAAALCVVSACAYGANLPQVEFHVSPMGDEKSFTWRAPATTVMRGNVCVPKLPADLSSIPGFEPLPPESAIGRPKDF